MTNPINDENGKTSSMRIMALSMAAVGGAVALIAVLKTGVSLTDAAILVGALLVPAFGAKAAQAIGGK